MPAVVAMCLLVAAPAAAQPPSASQSAAAERYASAVVRINALYVGVGAASLGVGALALRSGDEATAAMGWPFVLTGAIHVLVASLVLPRATRRRRAAGLDAATLERTRGAVDAQARRFAWFHAVEALGVAAGLSLSVAGAARGRPRLGGVGAGLLAQAGVTLVFDLALAEDVRAFAGRR